MFNRESMLAPGTTFVNLSFSLYITDGSNFKSFEQKTFIYLKLQYKNSINKIMNPLKKILVFEGNKLVEANNLEYNSVAKDLIKFNYY